MVKNAAPGVILDPKKSSYKKLSKFLAEKEKQGTIKVKELQKGILVGWLGRWVSGKVRWLGGWSFGLVDGLSIVDGLVN